MGQIEVPDSQLEIHILTPAYDEDGMEIEQTLIGIPYTIENQPWNTDGTDTIVGGITTGDDVTWFVHWRCDDSEGHPSIVQEGCMIQIILMSGMVEMTDADGETYMGAPSFNYDVKLYDTWAEDYTGNAMPSFTLGLTIVALLGSCLLVQRRKTE